MRLSPQCILAWLLILASGLIPAGYLRAAEPAPSRTTKPPAVRHANRLAKETSPYLLLHAHNPVDWFPWGEEAFAKAKRESKMIFLSVGYSSCYWCHVMERESFMNAEIAAFLNKHYVCIKVDREERPDIDEIYMTALQAMSQPGGWPLSIFLTPGAEPIIGGTYYPPVSTEERRGFLDVIQVLQTAWTDDRDAMQAAGKQVADHLRRAMSERPVLIGTLKRDLHQAILAELVDTFDPEHGGFGFVAEQPKRPKFPEPANLIFLQKHLQREPNGERERRMLLVTLDKMAEGGIRDHLGGGFHRYSTDRFWRIPHFEKMLYDNAQLASVYAEAYALTKNETYRQVVDKLIGFVQRELTDQQGGFYSALDAETDGDEGKYYAWTDAELKAALTPDELAIVGEVYGTATGPNFEKAHVLLLPESKAAIAKRRGQSEAELEAVLSPIRKKLLAARDKRERPLTDTKLIAGWNGLMIKGLADAGRLLEEPRYVEAAAKAATVMLARLTTKEGRLKHVFTAGEAKLNAYLDDYAYLVEGLIALHRATGEKAWLDRADQLTAKQIELFWDDRGGGFYFTSHDHEKLIVRSKNPVDGALPGGNSIAAANLLYLAEALDKPEYRDRARETLRASISLMERAPTAVVRMGAVLADFLATEP